MRQIVLLFIAAFTLATLLAPICANAAPTRLGDMQVFSLIDAQGTSPISLLVGATEEQIERYVPSRTLQSQILAFLVKFPDRSILFDAGLGASKGGKMMEALKEIGIAPSDIDAILLTHLHPDHFGGLVDSDGNAAFPRADVYVSRIEHDWWLNDRKDENVQRALALYKDRLHLFEFGDSLLSNVLAIDTSGHTPGHTAFHVRAKGKGVGGKDAGSKDAGGEVVRNEGGKALGELLVVGDALHFAEIQLPLPQISVAYDVDPVKAAQARKYILGMAAEKNIPVAGMHLSVPGLWRVNKGESGYEKGPLD